MVLPELTLEEEAPLESNWFLHTGLSMLWVTAVCHHVIVRSLFLLPVEGMEEGVRALQQPV